MSKIETKQWYETVEASYRLEYVDYGSNINVTMYIDDDEVEKFTIYADEIKTIKRSMSILLQLVN